MTRLSRLIVPPLKFLAGACALAIMLLTTVDVFARYILAAPIDGAYEAVQALLAIGIFAGLPLAGLRGEHISVRLIETSHIGAVGRWIDAFFTVVMAGVLFVVSLKIWTLANLVGSTQQTLGAYAIPLEPLYRSMSVLGTLAGLFLVLLVLPAQVKRNPAARSAE